MTEQPPDPQSSAEAPVDPLYTHPASPFIQTEAPPPVVLAPPPPGPPPSVASTWITYRTPIEFGLGILAYLMVLVGSVTVVQANPTADWRYYVVVLPVFPAALVIWMFVRALTRLDEMQKRIHLQAFGFSLGATGLVTFGYGFLEGAGMPHLSWTYVLPLMAVLWGVGAAIFTWRYR
jgi:hypothetical protein